MAGPVGERASDFTFQHVGSGVHALAVWDASWNSYNNCYLLTDGPGIILIDSQKSEHAEALVDALHRLGKSPADVSVIVATHGHHDHVGGARLFPHASKHIHPADGPLLTPDLRTGFNLDLPNEGAFLDFDVVLLGQHTAGSVALFHRPTSVLFCGDHVCFFGSALSSEGLVSYGADVRDRYRSFVSGWSRNWPPSAEERARLEADLIKRRPEDRERYNFDLFLRGIRKLQGLDAQALCTGHGGVLRGDIQEFFQDLI